MPAADWASVVWSCVSVSSCSLRNVFWTCPSVCISFSLFVFGTVGVF
jgi:hypothetical protein